MTEIQTQLPLTEATFLILLSLAPEPKHGYAIMQAVEVLSEGRVMLSTGTLYGALKRLLEQGWIERLDDDKTDETLRPRKVYILTKAGQGILKAETARLQALITVAQIHLAGGAA